MNKKPIDYQRNNISFFGKYYNIIIKGELSMNKDEIIFNQLCNVYDKYKKKYNITLSMLIRLYIEYSKKTGSESVIIFEKNYFLQSIDKVKKKNMMTKCRKKIIGLKSRFNWSFLKKFGIRFDIKKIVEGIYGIKCRKMRK